MFNFDIPTHYVIENKFKHRVYASMNTKSAALSEASYMDVSFPDTAPHTVFRLDIYVNTVEIPPRQ